MVHTPNKKKNTTKRSGLSKARIKRWVSTFGKKRNLSKTEIRAVTNVVLDVNEGKFQFVGVH